MNVVQYSFASAVDSSNLCDCYLIRNSLSLSVSVSLSYLFHSIPTSLCSVYYLPFPSSKHILKHARSHSRTHTHTHINTHTMLPHNKQCTAPSPQHISVRISVYISMPFLLHTHSSTLPTTHAQTHAQLSPNEHPITPIHPTLPSPPSPPLPPKKTPKQNQKKPAYTPSRVPA